MKQILWSCLAFLSLSAAAQDDFYQKKAVPTTNRSTTIMLKDGSKLRGKLVRQDSVEVLLQNADLGEIRVPASQIVSMEQTARPSAGVGYPNLFPQTMPVVPTAFQAEKGKLYYRNYMILLNQFEYGITDNWSAGTTFYVFGPINLFSVNTKVSFPVSRRVRLGVNGQYIALRFNDALFGHAFGQIGYVQGVVTVGERQNNTTFGIGATVANGDVSRNLIGTIGFVRKLNPKLTFISENFVLLGQGSTTFAGILSGGIRFDRRRHAFDVAAYVPLIITRVTHTYVGVSAFAAYHLRFGK